MSGFREPLRHLEIILSLVASFSQSMSPWRAMACHADLTQVQFPNYNFCVHIYSDMSNSN